MRSTRRDAVKAVGTTLAAAAFGGASAIAVAEARGGGLISAGSEGARTQAQSELERALSTLEGAVLRTCTIERVDPATHGAIPVTLVDADGERFTVDVLRHDDATPGVARAGSLAVYMRARSRRTAGEATREEHGLAAMDLAVLLQEREKAGHKVPDLLTLSERAEARARYHRREARGSAS